MNARPVRRTDNILSKTMMIKIVLHGVYMAAVLIAAFFCRLVLFLFRYPLAGVTGAAPVLLRYDLPHAVYSAVLAVPLYYPVRALHRMAEERTDTRL